MIVKFCKWISKDAQEALLTVGGNDVECVAFSHPCCFCVGDHLLEPLLAISIGNVILENSSSEFFIRRIGNGFSHEVLGQVVDLERRLVSVGSIIVELDDVLPGGISCGDMVGFSCGRLDVIS